MGRFDFHKDIAIRTLGVAMFSFPMGMGVGAVFAHDWFKGGAIAFASTMLIVISFVGVVLAWTGKLTSKDIKEAYQTATAKAGEDNDIIHEVLNNKKVEK
jgi:hypothetical protein